MPVKDYYNLQLLHSILYNNPCGDFLIKLTHFCCIKKFALLNLKMQLTQYKRSYKYCPLKTITIPIQRTNCNVLYKNKTPKSMEPTIKALIDPKYFH